MASSSKARHDKQAKKRLQQHADERTHFTRCKRLPSTTRLLNVRFLEYKFCTLDFQAGSWVKVPTSRGFCSSPPTGIWAPPVDCGHHPRVTNKEFACKRMCRIAMLLLFTDYATGVR
jgi:hypothetical protein